MGMLRQLFIGQPPVDAILVPHTKILFVTQEDDAEVVRAALCNGAVGYVLKADAVRELLPAIESALRGERFVSRGVRGNR